METITIKTTQNVTIEYDPAPYSSRLIAFVIDFFIVNFSFNILRSIIGIIIPGSMSGRAIILIGIAVLFLYHFVMEVFADGQSLGKKLLKIKVVKLNGSEPRVSDHLLRTIFLLVDFLFTAGILGSVLIISSGKKQRLGDIAAGTALINKTPSSKFKLSDILEIDDLDVYEPQYPEIRNMKESDMLLVKKVIQRYQRYRNRAHSEAVVQTVERISELLELEEVPKKKIAFLKTVLKDYIVLTR